MPDLHGLVRRRLFELDLSADEASRRSRGLITVGLMRAIVRGSWTIPISDRLARALARVLDVPQDRVRRAAGLPVEEYVGDPTGPHLRVVRDDGPS